MLRHRIQVAFDLHLLDEQRHENSANCVRYHELEREDFSVKHQVIRRHSRSTGIAFVHASSFTLIEISGRDVTSMVVRRQERSSGRSLDCSTEQPSAFFRLMVRESHPSSRLRVQESLDAGWLRTWSRTDQRVWVYEIQSAVLTMKLSDATKILFLLMFF